MKSIKNNYLSDTSLETKSTSSHTTKIDSPIVVYQESPLNSEPKPQTLKANYITPANLFFKRNHGAFPTYLNTRNYFLKLSVSSMIKKITKGHKTLQFTYEELTNMPRNRRNELNKIQKVEGVPWSGCTISNSYWKGVKLKHLLDLIIDSDIQDNLDHKNMHVVFEAYGETQSSENTNKDNYYGASIPLEYALDETNDVLLAYEMNDTTLSIEHGYPIRVIVPGVIGARSVKHLEKIIISHTESTNYYQRVDYKLYPKHVNKHNVLDHCDKYDAIQDFEVQSFICHPRSKDQLVSFLNENSNMLTIEGYAISGGGRKIKKVMLSFDKGNSWNIEVTELHQEKVGSKYWSWCHWSFILKDKAYLKDAKSIACCAIDSEGKMQPQKSKWNYRGVMNNCWDIVDFEL